MKKVLTSLLFTALLHNTAFALENPNDAFNDELDRHLHACLMSPSYTYCSVDIGGPLQEAILRDETWQLVRYTHTPEVSGATIYRRGVSGGYEIYVYEWGSTQRFSGNPADGRRALIAAVEKLAIGLLLPTVQ